MVPKAEKLWRVEYDNWWNQDRNAMPWVLYDPRGRERGRFHGEKTARRTARFWNADDETRRKKG